MDDLLVVILTLIIAGAGALGQLKKKKQTSGDIAGNLNSPEDIWNLFKDDPVLSHLAEDPHGTKEVFVKEPGPAVNEQNYTFNPKNEGGKIIETATAKPAVTPKKESVFKGNFSLRDAVIYNEILNRKYF
ncbi:MAG TPA: hypothetical protein DER09_10135 [Prolixibacteraceae bacterium]|nr:hypothetical protein [Prolixibacteraceae bacterium]